MNINTNETGIWPNCLNTNSLNTCELTHPKGKFRHFTTLIGRTLYYSRKRLVLDNFKYWLLVFPISQGNTLLKLLSIVDFVIFTGLSNMFSNNCLTWILAYLSSLIEISRELFAFGIIHNGHPQVKIGDTC